MKFRALLALSTCLVLAACGKNNDYVYKQSSVDAINISESHAVVADGGRVDILWVIDNSLSMSDIHSAVISNAAAFMQEFTKYGALDWRMGLLSSDISDAPYLGFKTLFDHRTPDAVRVFQDAVSQLGVAGSGTEQFFAPASQALVANPLFLRSDAWLILIFVTDEKEQSGVTAQNFMAGMAAMKGGRANMVRVYGAFNAQDFGCPTSYSTSDQVVYAGSPFEAVIRPSGGSAYSTCAPDFGPQLASLGRNIVGAVSSPIVLLKQRPQASSITVYYRGDILPGGPVNEGGKWFYDPQVNGIRFHDLEFVDFNVKKIRVDYQVDQGE